jgi:hypothetical protein
MRERTRKILPSWAISIGRKRERTDGRSDEIRACGNIFSHGINRPETRLAPPPIALVRSWLLFHFSLHTSSPEGRRVCLNAFQNPKRSEDPPFDSQLRRKPSHGRTRQLNMLIWLSASCSEEVGYAPRPNSFRLRHWTCARLVL